MANDTFYAFKSSFKHLANGGVMLVAVTVLALIVANTGWSTAYFSILDMPLNLQIGSFSVFAVNGEQMTVLEFINDALMAIFFFSVGLEIKREVLVGELSSFKQAILPIIGACGGMIVPIAIYSLVGVGHADVLRGRAVPMATDIAFSLGVLSLLGSRVPASLKIFLATLAVADDIGGIITIAIFYSSNLHLGFLLVGVLLLAVLLVASHFGVKDKLFYLAIGGLVWYMFLHSGIHSTIAGVLTAFCIPARPKMQTSKYIERIRSNIAHFPVTDASDKRPIILTKEQINLLKSVESASDKVVSPLQDLEDSLHSLVNYIIIPLFAFANAGLSFKGFDLGGIGSGATLPVMAGLLVGKPLGIFAATYLAVKSKIASISSATNWKMFFGVALLGGIGFTVSIFLANLSFPGAEGVALLNQAKFGILTASLLAGIAGYLWLNHCLPKSAAVEE